MGRCDVPNDGAMSGEDDDLRGESDAGYLLSRNVTNVEAVAMNVSVRENMPSYISVPGMVVTEGGGLPLCPSARLS